MRRHAGALVVLVCSVFTLGALTAFVFSFLPPWWSSSTRVMPPYLFPTSYSERHDFLGVFFHDDGGVVPESDYRRMSSRRRSLRLGVGSAEDEETGDGTGQVEMEVEVGSELLTSEVSSKALLADGKPRCFVQSGIGMTGSRKGRCLPNVFSIGVSKCGTTSLSNWMAQHPRTRWVPPRPGYSYLEAHVFDAIPEVWDSLNAANLRHRLAVEASPGDAVLDYTPHYSMVAETPFRIKNLYGDGPLRREGLKFLVVLREPVSRTISSWEYKSDPEKLAEAAASKTPEQLQEYLTTHALEARPLSQAVAEGIEGATSLASCVSNATALGVFGQGEEVISCEEDEGQGSGVDEGCKTEIEPRCNPQDLFLEGNLYDAHVGKSMYALQLSRWFNMFGRDKFKVLFTEDMAADPVGTLETALNFLGLDLLNTDEKEGLRSIEEWNDIVGVRYNEGDPAKKALLGSQVTPDILETLGDFFVPHNKALEELLGKTLPSSWGVQR